MFPNILSKSKFWPKKTYYRLSWIPSLKLCFCGGLMEDAMALMESKWWFLFKQIIFLKVEDVGRRHCLWMIKLAVSRRLLFDMLVNGFIIPIYRTYKQGYNPLILTFYPNFQRDVSKQGTTSINIKIPGLGQWTDWKWTTGLTRQQREITTKRKPSKSESFDSTMLSVFLGGQTCTSQHKVITHIEGQSNNTNVWSFWKSFHCNNGFLWVGNI